MAHGSSVRLSFTRTSINTTTLPFRELATCSRVRRVQPLLNRPGILIHQRACLCRGHPGPTTLQKRSCSKAMHALLSLIAGRWLASMPPRVTVNRDVPTHRRCGRDAGGSKQKAAWDLSHHILHVTELILSSVLFVLAYYPAKYLNLPFPLLSSK